MAVPLGLLIVILLVVVDVGMELEEVFLFIDLVAPELPVVLRLLCNVTGCLGFSTFLL